MKKLRGFTLIELLIVVAIIAILAAIAVPNFLEAQIRSKVSRARADMRSLATGIEAYFVDNNSYPACTVTPAWSINNSARGNASSRVTFRTPRTTSEMLATLTSPIAYINNVFADPFAESKGAAFGYYASGEERTDVRTRYSNPGQNQKGGWILVSYGPDVDESTTNGDQVESVYKVTVSQPSLTMITLFWSGTPVTDCYTYDPTNGTVSGGDVYRPKQ